MIEFFILLVFGVAPLLAIYIGYRKLNKSSKKKTITETVKSAEPSDQVILHDHDLAKWNYLGYTRCLYVDENGKTTGEHTIFLFSSKRMTSVGLILFPAGWLLHEITHM